ncbi:response regulator [Cytophagaceae bacterium ABcell3]|nr:response regulator [Cytophagaceae bacterium ABcell3]
MKFLRNINIKAKLLTLLVLLLTPLIYFVQDNVRSEVASLNRLRSLKENVDNAGKLGIFIHALQRERAISHAYVASGGELFIDELHNQRAEVDNLMRRYSVDEINNFNSLIELRRLPEHRENVTELREGALDFDTFYTNLISGMIGDLEMLAGFIEGNVRNEINSFLSIVNTKEQLGQMRTLLSRALVLNEFSPSSFSVFASSKGAYDIYTGAFLAEAPPNVFDFYNQTFRDDEVSTTLSIIDHIMETGTLEGAEIDLGRWYSIATVAMDKLMDVQDFSINYLSGRLSDEIDAGQRAIYFNIGILLVLILLVILMSLYTIRIISGPLYKLQMAADSIASGKTDVSVDIDSKDEIGALANSFRVLIANTLQLSEVANAIGSGNYGVDVNIRSEDDVLGISLQKMKENLKALSVNEKEKNWLLSGSGELDDLVRGEKDLGTLSKKLLSHFCSYLDLQIGAMYVKDDYDKLRLSASYGFNLEEANSNVFDLGEGIVGQAAYDKEVKYLEQVPDGYWKVKSGVLNGYPQVVVVYPLIFEGQVMGVIELASMNEIQELQLKYIDQNLDRIAIIIANVKADIKTAELLYQTQNQAEEMEAQQEELRQINDELKEQSQRLQASEEELKANQEELQEKNAELEEKANQLEEQYKSINGKNKELEELKEALQLKVDQLEVTGKYKTEFLANMSHELRTPLNSILILAKILSENKAHNLTEKQVEFCEIIQKSGKELLSLINEILDLAKIESGKVSLELSDIKISSLISEAQYQELAKEKGIKFSLNVDNALPTGKVHTDAFRLEQILKNLLSNAFKFTPEGGEVSLNIKPAPDITFYNPSLKQSADVIAFEVKDSGIGIPEEKQRLIFEAFQQADSSTSRKYGGTGLGLSISKELAMLLGGEIQLYSKPGEGSSFTLYIPARLTVEMEREEGGDGSKPKKQVQQQAYSEAPVAAAPVYENPEPEAPQVDVRPGDRLILIIEDDKDFAEAVKEVAVNKGFKTMVAHKGRQGLEMVQKYRPDAVLLDVNLPEMDGIEILKQIRANKHLENTPVHVMSADDKEKVSRQLGAINFLQKPVSLDSLQDIFKQISEINNKPLKKILIVEDNTVQNLSIKELLSSRGIPAGSVFSGKEALDVLKKENYDCVILDINLPDINGFDLLEQCKEIDKLKDTPFIIYSGRELSREEEKRLRKYSSAIIVKTANSYNRLLDEVGLFLHTVEEKLPKGKEKQYKLHKPQEVLAGKKVLIVDDDIRNIYALYNVLEDQSMEILTAGDGKEALEVLEKNPDVNIVLMDIMMPEMDGYEATRQIRKNDKFKDLPVIAITAKAMKGDKEKCIEAGASDYISKPVDTDKLLSLMKVWLYESVRKII